MKSVFAAQLENCKSYSWLGLLLCVALAGLALPMGAAFPLVGAPIAGLLLGLVVGNVLSLPAVIEPSIQFGAKQLLKWAIVGLGLQISLQQLWQVGLASLSITLVTVSLAFVAAYLVGRWLGLSNRLVALIGVGTAICGASAIAAVAAILKPNKKELTLALAIIFFFNVLAVFVFPYVGHSLSLSDAAFGLWAGTAINDTSSVVAAAFSYSYEAGNIATVVKLTRASLIVPICLVLAWVMSRGGDKTSGVAKSFPWFVVGFVLAVLVHSVGLLPVGFEQLLVELSHFLLVVALVAVGLQSSLKQLALAGGKPLLLGLVVSLVVAVSSFVLI